MHILKQLKRIFPEVPLLVYIFKYQVQKNAYITRAKFSCLRKYMRMIGSEKMSDRSNLQKGHIFFLFQNYCRNLTQNETLVAVILVTKSQNYSLLRLLFVLYRHLLGKKVTCKRKRWQKVEIFLFAEVLTLKSNAHCKSRQTASRTNVQKCPKLKKDKINLDCKIKQPPCGIIQR